MMLPVAIELGVTLQVEEACDGLELVSEQFGPASEGWGRYAQAVHDELAELGRPPVGIRGTITSTLPAGAGLSSSAALEVAVALALCEAAGWHLEPLELAEACRRDPSLPVPDAEDLVRAVLGLPGDAPELARRLLDERPELDASWANAVSVAVVELRDA